MKQQNKEELEDGQEAALNDEGEENQ
jgi:hypothetical protein